MKKFADINKEFSEIVAGYLATGYTINAGTMHGSESGELAKVDLTDGKEIIRVLLEKGRDFRLDVKFDAEYVVLKVGKVVDKGVAINTMRDFEIVWNSHLEIISEKYFYKPWMRGKDVELFFTKEETVEIEQKREERSERKDACEESKTKEVEVKLNDVMKEKMKDVVRRHFDMKRPVEKFLKVTKKGGEYIVWYHEDSVALQ